MGSLLSRLLTSAAPYVARIPLVGRLVANGVDDGVRAATNLGDDAVRAGANAADDGARATAARSSARPVRRASEPEGHYQRRLDDWTNARDAQRAAAGRSANAADETAALAGRNADAPMSMGARAWNGFKNTVTGTLSRLWTVTKWGGALFIGTQALNYVAPNNPITGQDSIVGRTLSTGGETAEIVAGSFNDQLRNNARARTEMSEQSLRQTTLNNETNDAINAGATGRIINMTPEVNEQFLRASTAIDQSALNTQEKSIAHQILDGLKNEFNRDGNISQEDANRVMTSVSGRGSARAVQNAADYVMELGL